VIDGGTGISFVSDETRQQLADRMGALPLGELGVRTMTVRPATLNDVFLHLTARAREHDLATIAGGRA
jgi:hypothetical protein